MPNLVLELKPGDMMVINGATIRFRTKSRIELLCRARFLFGRQIMAAHDATTPAKKLYHTLQTAYIGADEERMRALAELPAHLDLLDTEANVAAPQSVVDLIRQKVAADDFYAALKLGRSLMEREEQNGLPGNIKHHQKQLS